MIEDEFVIEEADNKTILVRHLTAGVRFLFVIRGRTFSDMADNKPELEDSSLRNQARAFALQVARIQGWVD